MATFLRWLQFSRRDVISDCQSFALAESSTAITCIVKKRLQFPAPLCILNSNLVTLVPDHLSTTTLSPHSNLAFSRHENQTSWKPDSLSNKYLTLHCELHTGSLLGQKYHTRKLLTSNLDQVTVVNIIYSSLIRNINVKNNIMILIISVSFIFCN